jgi:signal recognition particle GTPase
MPEGKVEGEVPKKEEKVEAEKPAQKEEFSAQEMSELVRKLQEEIKDIHFDYDKYDIKQIELLKIDVEGLECEIISSNVRLNTIKRIVLEYHSGELRYEIIRFLEKNKFKLVHETKNQSDYYGDMYFINETLICSHCVCTD